MRRMFSLAPVKIWPEPLRTMYWCAEFVYCEVRRHESLRSLIKTEDVHLLVRFFFLSSPTTNFVCIQHFLYHFFICLLYDDSRSFLQMGYVSLLELSGWKYARHSRTFDVAIQPIQIRSYTFHSNAYIYDKYIYVFGLKNHV